MGSMGTEEFMEACGCYGGGDAWQQRWTVRDRRIREQRLSSASFQNNIQLISAFKKLSQSHNFALLSLLVIFSYEQKAILY